MRCTGLWLLALMFCLPAQAEEWKLLEPGMPVVGSQGEQVLVRLKGPKGQQPALALGSRRFELGETGEGLYSGFLTISERPQQLALVDSSGRLDLGRVSPDETPRFFEASDEAVTRQGPLSDYDRLTPLYAGTRVRLNGTRGGWHRAAGSGTWIDATGGRVVEGVLPPNRLNRVLVEQSPDGDALLRFQCDRAGEVQVLHSVAEQRLKLRLEDTLQTCFDVKRPTGVADFLGPVLLRPQTDGSVEVEISGAELCGYQVEPEASANQVTLRVRKPLPKSFRGLKITVDAGHGGPKDRGTVGHGGLEEKVLNLRVAEELATQLRARGAEVLMTRTTDADVASQSDGDANELQARIDRSMAAGGRLFLSVHHNARPDVEQGKQYHGTDVYWYQPHSQSLAKHLANPIADAIGEELRSFRWRSFYVIRQTHSPAVLIEFQYLSNPVLEKTVLDQPDYPGKAARAVVEGLESYLKDRP